MDETDYFRLADHPEVGQTSQYKRVYQALRDPLIELRERDLCNELARLFRADKITLQISGDSARGGYHRKTGYCFFPDAEAAAGAIEVSFLYSALA